MSLAPTSRSKFNLKNASVLLVVTGLQSLDVLVQILVGFGAKNFSKCETVGDARESLKKTPFDLIIIDAVIGEEDGYDLMSWVRREAPEINRYVPVIMVSGHTARSKVVKARDCGAHFTVAKPLTPIVLLERILWIAQERRPFVNTDCFAGPDRRFKFTGPPVGSAGRRRDDLSANVGEAKEPNLSQAEIDSLMAPQKVAL